MTELEKEKEHLKEAITKLKEIIEEEKLLLKKYYEDAKDDDDIWYRIIETNLHIRNLEASLNNPYFARIDFKFDDKNNSESIYIGRYGVYDGIDAIVTDWRAPISSLYYDGEIGKCSFDSPDGIMTGELELKRQFEILKGKLLDYFDVNLVTDDILLQKYLKNNNDTRLKNIIATIQKEQNEVIRKKIQNNIIVQGVAGSGKTTVALHRIAYLVYNYRNRIKQNQYMVIGPNPIFLKYIESVLPELDVASVSQVTFEEFAKDYIKEEININLEQKAPHNIKLKNDIGKFKSSLKYKSMLDYFIAAYLETLTSKDLELGDFVVVNHNIIKEIFNRFDRNIGIENVINNTIKLLTTYIEQNIDKITTRYNEYFYTLMDNTSDAKEKEKIKLKSKKEREELDKCCKSTIRKYFSKSKMSPTKLYKLFISMIEDINIYQYTNIKQLKKETLANIKQNKYNFEDLAALVYLRKIFFENNEYKRYRHIVIDEAQDLGEFNFKVLKDIFETSTFSIFGDLAQSIYDNRGINNWDTVNSIMFNNKAQIINFNKSYRTTQEIMNIADEVAEYIGLNRSEYVVRHGKNVGVKEIIDEQDISKYIISIIEKYKEKGYKTIAIISKTEELSKQLNNELAHNGLIIPNIDLNDNPNDEKFAICTISNQLAKGLEFDAVIINNAGEEIYSSANPLDMKLLYVAITRALHELDILYTSTLTKPLQKLLIKEKNLTRKKDH